MDWFGLKISDRVQRALTEAAFEADGESFLYYPDGGSRGIAVTAAERLLYIEGPQRQFFDAIAGRPATGPKRNRFRPYVRFLAAQPAELGMLYGVISLFAMRDALRSDPGPWQTMLFATAAFFVVNATVPLAVRTWLNRVGNSQPERRQ